jgi:hypothetical protein
LRKLAAGYGAAGFVLFRVHLLQGPRKPSGHIADIEPLHQIREFWASTQFIESRILRKREKLHVALAAGALEPAHGLALVAQCDMGSRYIVGRDTLPKWHALQLLEDRVCVVPLSGPGMGMRLHG